MQMPIGLRLARHGVIVLLLSLLTGFGIPRFHNPHLGNVAHLAGLIGGFGLVVFGLLWPRLNLGGLWSALGAWSMSLAMYLSWLGLVLTGAFANDVWIHTGQIAVALGSWLSLFATLVILVGLRGLTRPEGARAARGPELA